MKKKFKLQRIIMIIGIVLIFCNQTVVTQANAQKPNEVNISELKGPYLGQKPPGLTSESFTPGVK